MFKKKGSVVKIKILLISLLVQFSLCEIIKLPQPKYKGKISVEEAIFNRKSIRNYKPQPLNINEVSQLLWASGGMTCDGITGPTRAYPSAGACYPLEIYLVCGNLTDQKAGLYKYLWKEHSLELIKLEDLRTELTSASFGQSMIKNAPISIIFAANVEKTTRRYGERGMRYIMMDLGHAGQNLYLQAEALNLGTVAIGAFNDKEVKKVLGISEDPLYIMPVGMK